MADTFDAAAERLAKLVADEIGSANDYCCQYGQGWSVKDIREIVLRHATALRSEYERGRDEAIARYHTLLQNVHANLDPEEKPELCAAVVAALTDCPPACSSPECERIGYERGRADGAREEREAIEQQLREAAQRASDHVEKLKSHDHGEPVRKQMISDYEREALVLRGEAEMIRARGEREGGKRG